MSARNEELRRLGAELESRDLECYGAFGRDPDEPIVGEGDPDARLCLFGRDPGREEVRHGVPFIGAGGQKLRAGLHRALGGGAYDFEASVRVGAFAFWANMVPFKPIENKAWPMRIVRRFRPVVADLLVHAWNGADVITLGQGALLWFGLDDPLVARALEQHWARADAFDASIAVELGAGGDRRDLRLHPLPHPSPLNATWAARFPSLLDARLRSLQYTQDNWRRTA
jgi:uracil-DNA glycosylase